MADAFDPTQLRRVPKDDQPGHGFDPSQLRLVPMDGTNPSNTGIGAAVGGIAAAIPEVIGPGKAKALSVAATGGKADKITHALVGEGKIAAGAAAGDLAETGLSAALSGNLPVAKQALASAKDEALFSFGFGTALRGATGAFNKLTFRPSATQTPAVNLAYDFFDEAMKQQGKAPLTLAAATDNAAVDLLDNVTRASIGGAGPMASFDASLDDVSNVLLNTVSENLGPKESVDDLGRSLFDAFMHQEQISDLPAVVLRNTVAKQAHDAGVRGSSTEIVAFIQKNLDDVDAIGGFGASLSGVTASKALLNIAEEPTVQNLVQLRSIAKSTVRSLEADKVTAATPQIGMMKTIATLADRAVKDALGKHDVRHGTELLPMFTRSNQLFATHYDKFFNKIVNKLKKSIHLKGGGNPARLAELLVKPERKNSLNFIKAAKAAWPEQEWPRVQRAAIDLIREQVTDLKTQRINGVKLGQLVASGEKFGSKKRIGEQSMDQLFGPDLAKDLRRFSEALIQVQSKTPTEVGKFPAQIAQGVAAAGAGAQLLGGEILAPAALLAGIVAVPRVFAWAMTNPRVVKAFTKGMKMKPTNPAWPALQARILSAVSAANLHERLDAGPIPPSVIQEREAGSMGALLHQVLPGPLVTQ